MGKLTREQALLMSGYIPLSADDVYSSGGSIDIKDSKKGTFTAAATKHGKSVQAFASQVLANKDNYSPAMVKKANFARNASKWKHQDGGAAGGDDQQTQIIAIIQAYAKAAKMDPKDIVKQIDSLPEDQKLPFIQSLADKLQGTQMQEGGPTPEELTGQEQPQGDDQLMQGIQQALQQGATPEELIAELIQQQVDPQMIVQIFVQLGMPQEQVVQVVEAVMQQMGGGQEQEVPQEQMQEQGMEEPMQESMEYGGVPQYPYGGLYANDYAANFMPDSQTNRFLTNTNMLSDPSTNYRTQGMAAAGFKPAIALEGVKGIASMFAGSAAGYKGAYNKLFGSKDAPGEITAPQAQNYYSKYFKNTGDTFAKKMENKYFDTPKINPYGQNTSIPSIATPPFNPNGKKFGPGFMHGGELPHAQVGIPPGFVEGMGVGQDGYGGVDNSMYNYDPNAPTAADIKLYEDQQALGAAGQNTISISDRKLANDQGKNDGYAFPRYAPKTNSKTLDTPNTMDISNPIGVSGDSMYNNAMIGAAATSNFIDMFDTDPETLFKRAQRKANQDTETAMLYNPKNPYGERTPNAGILKPNMRTVQDVGSSQFSRYGGATKYANGGQMQYQQGGEYHVTHDELLRLMQNGAEVEFL